MELRSRAIDVVRRAEAELRQLLLRSAEQGDYETARISAEWAKQLKQMVQHNDSVDCESRPVELADDKSPAHAERELLSATVHKRSNTRKAKTRRVRRTRKPKRAKGDYPKFLREGEELLKIGWSKREKKVYRHKAPKRVVLMVAQALQKAGQHNDRFVMEKTLPIPDPENEDEIPSYQAYLSLAWLRKEELIVQHGRQGYSLLPNVNLPGAVEERWNLLPKS